MPQSSLDPKPSATASFLTQPAEGARSHVESSQKSKELLLPIVVCPELKSSVHSVERTRDCLAGVLWENGFSPRMGCLPPSEIRSPFRKGRSKFPVPLGKENRDLHVFARSCKEDPGSESLSPLPDLTGK